MRGPQSLSEAELLAILLRTGTKGRSVIQLAQLLLIEYEGRLSVLSEKSVEALKHFNGIGNDKAATLCAAFELSRRLLSQEKWIVNKKITSPKDVADIFIPLLKDKNQEEFIVVCLSTANKIVKYKRITMGTLNTSVIQPREVFRTAIENDAANIILIHNHPSGNPDPSQEDILFTKKIAEAGKIMDIQIFDHLIIAGSGYTSFVERRLI
jgi:DNA repair protein RadC